MSKRKRLTDADRQRIVDAYLRDTGRSLADIAQEVGFGRRTVARVLDAAGARSRSPSPILRGAAVRDRNAEILDRARANVPYPEIAAEFGVSRANVSRIATRAGVVRRSRLEDDLKARILWLAERGVPNAEIAQELDVPLGTVHYARSRAEGHLEMPKHVVGANDIAAALRRRPLAIHSLREVLDIPHSDQTPTPDGPWNATEDAILLANPLASVERLMAVTGRTADAIRTRRRDLKRRTG